ncbi:MAG: signal peptidase I [bacterium]
MTWTEWLIFVLIIQVIHGLGTWKLYQKAGRKAWEAFVPVYNGIILMKIINRPWWWIFLLFLPIINLIMFPVVWVETARSFGRNWPKDTALAVLSLGFYNYYLNYFDDVTHVPDRSRDPQSSSGEWTSSILFAIVAATFVHTYFMQPFIIPSSSLEKSLLVGDFLFVSKFHYGPRTPMTTVAAPMVHDTIPIVKKKSYLFDDQYDQKNTSWKNKLQLPYFRFPGFEKIDRNEIVVFNQPADTLLDMNDFRPDRNYYKPIDKKTNLVKRCVGLPGDSLQIKEGYVYINGEKNVIPDRGHLQFSYFVQPKSRTFNPTVMATRYDITDPIGIINKNNTYRFSAVSDEAAAKLKNHPNVLSLEKMVIPEGQADPSIFPHDSRYPWNMDFFGPLYIPQKGATINLNTEILPLYKRVIQEYEQNDVKVEGNTIYVNGEKADSYTFKQDYYWMMGDNRHNSIDARSWGFVPYNHVVGKPVFIWMSYNSYGKGFGKIRTDRVFTTVHGTGERTSYFIPTVLVILGIVGFNKWRKKRKASA